MIGLPVLKKYSTVQENGSSHKDKEQLGKETKVLVTPSNWLNPALVSSVNTSIGHIPPPTTFADDFRVQQKAQARLTELTENAHIRDIEITRGRRGVKWMYTSTTGLNCTMNLCSVVKTKRESLITSFPVSSGWLAFSKTLRWSMLYHDK